MPVDSLDKLIARKRSENKAKTLDQLIAEKKANGGRSEVKPKRTPTPYADTRGAVEDLTRRTHDFRQGTIDAALENQPAWMTSVAEARATQKPVKKTVAKGRKPLPYRKGNPTAKDYAVATGEGLQTGLRSVAQGAVDLARPALILANKASGGAIPPPPELEGVDPVSRAVGYWAPQLPMFGAGGIPSLAAKAEPLIAGLSPLARMAARTGIVGTEAVLGNAAISAPEMLEGMSPQEWAQQQVKSLPFTLGLGAVGGMAPEAMALRNAAQAKKSRYVMHNKIGEVFEVTGVSKNGKQIDLVELGTGRRITDNPFNVTAVPESQVAAMMQGGGRNPVRPNTGEMPTPFGVTAESGGGKGNYNAPSWTRTQKVKKQFQEATTPPKNALPAPSQASNAAEMVSGPYDVDRHLDKIWQSKADLEQRTADIERALKSNPDMSDVQASALYDEYDRISAQLATVDDMRGQLEPVAMERQNRLAEIDADQQTYQPLLDYTTTAKESAGRGRHDVVKVVRRNGKTLTQTVAKELSVYDLKEVAATLNMTPQEFTQFAKPYLKGAGEFKVVNRANKTARVAGELDDVITSYELNQVKRGIRDNIKARRVEVKPVDGQSQLDLGVTAPESTAVKQSVIEPVKPPATTQSQIAAKPSESNGGAAAESADNITYLNAGPNIAEGIRQADDLNIRPREGGSFKVERERKPGRDYDARDRFLQPIGIYDDAGSPIQKGVYDRLGKILNDDGSVENVGQQAGQRIREAQRTMDEGILHAQQKLDRIGQLVEMTVPKKTLSPRVNPKKVEQAFSDFVDLVERPIDDAERIRIKASSTPTGEALKIHDEMTDGFRDYIIESRRSMGIETPDDWGITDRGYFRHLFLGDIRVFKNGDFVGTARTYAEAQKQALDILKTDPNANITARARDTFKGDPALRVSTRRFFKVVNDLSEDIGLSKEEIMADLRGVIGRKGAKQKWFGALLERKGAKGYSKAYMDVMRMHSSQVFRTQELSKMNRAVQPMTEKLRASGKPGLAQAIEDHVNDLWGTPTTWEKSFGELLKNIPIIRNHVPMPAMAFRHLARQITGLQTATKLRVSPRSAVVNLIQPFSTLWPYVKTTEFAALYKDFTKPSTRRMLAERGVLEGSTKIESVGVHRTDRAGSTLNPLNWFQKASEVNRGVGYLFGYRKGIAEGLSEANAHNLGLSWAEKVEFDNSTWNVQAMLRDPRARVLGQFKSFQGKNMENVREIFTPENLSRAERLGRGAKWATAQIGVGGVKSLGVLATAAGGYKIINHLSKELRGYGMEAKEANEWAKAVYYGAPSLLGQDLSASVSILEAPYGRTTLEKSANFVFGPTVGTAAGLYDAAKKGDAEKALKAVTPAFKPYDVAKQAYKDGLDNTKVKVGNKQFVELTPFEAVMRGLGFTPLKQSEVYDKKDAGIGKSNNSPARSRRR